MNSQGHSKIKPRVIARSGYAVAKTVPVETKRAPIVRRVPNKKPVINEAKESSEETDSSESEVEIQPAPRKLKKTQPALPPKPIPIDLDIFDPLWVPPAGEEPGQAVVQKTKKVPQPDSSSESESEPEVTPPPKPRKSQKPQKKQTIDDPVEEEQHPPSIKNNMPKPQRKQHHKPKPIEYDVEEPIEEEPVEEEPTEEDDIHHLGHETEKALQDFNQLPSRKLPLAPKEQPKKSPKDWYRNFENTSTSLGMNKNIITWEFVWKRQKHSIELHHSTFGGKRKILIDGRIHVQEKKPLADQSRYSLRIAQKQGYVNVTILIQAAGLTDFSYELVIEKKPYLQALKYWLSNPEI